MAAGTEERAEHRGGLSDAAPDSYLYLARLPAEYDVVIFLDQTTASVPLPFNYPRSF